MKISALIIEFLSYVKSNNSQQTVKNYRHYLKRFLDFSDDLAVQKIDLDLINNYKRYLSNWVDPKTQKNLKPVTQNYFLIALRALFKYASPLGITTFSAEKIELNNHHSKDLDILDEVSVTQLLESPNITEVSGLRDRAILELLFSTGLLVSELVSLNRDHINNKTEFEIIGKGGKKRTVFISEAAGNWLRRYLFVRKDTFKPLFVRFQGQVDIKGEGEDMRLSTRSIERIVKKYAKRLNLSITVTPQTLRHSFAKSLLNEGSNLHSIQTALGHSHLSTTKIYAKI